jgi:hypothetical protein
MKPQPNIHHNIAEPSIEVMDVAIERSTSVPVEVNAVLKCIARALGRSAARDHLASQQTATSNPNGPPACPPPQGGCKP